MPKRVVKLGTSIDIHDPKTGETRLYVGGQTVPAEDVDLVNHDLAWESEENVASYQEYLRNIAGSNSDLEFRSAGSTEDEGDEDVALEDMTVPALRAYADAHDIDLGNATRKDDVLAAIEAAESV